MPTSTYEKCVIRVSYLNDKYNLENIENVASLICQKYKINIFLDYYNCEKQYIDLLLDLSEEYANDLWHEIKSDLNYDAEAKIFMTGNAFSSSLFIDYKYKIIIKYPEQYNYSKKSKCLNEIMNHTFRRNYNSRHYTLDEVCILETKEVLESKILNLKDTFQDHEFRIEEKPFKNKLRGHTIANNALDYASKIPERSHTTE